MNLNNISFPVMLLGPIISCVFQSSFANFRHRTRVSSFVKICGVMTLNSLKLQRLYNGYFISDFTKKICFFQLVEFRSEKLTSTLKGRSIEMEILNVSETAETMTIYYRPGYIYENSFHTL